MTDPDNPHALPIPWSVRIAFAVLAVLGVASAGFGLASTRADAAQERSDEISACRSAFSAELITGPTVAALKALATTGVDSPEFRAAVDRADEERFVELAVLSRTDQEAFLELCHATG